MSALNRSQFSARLVAGAAGFPGLLLCARITVSGIETMARVASGGDCRGACAAAATRQGNGGTRTWSLLDVPVTSQECRVSNESASGRVIPLCARRRTG